MNAKTTFKDLEQRVKDLERALAESKQAAEALRESELRYRLLWEKAPVGYQSLDEEGHYIEVNDTWLDTFGYTREEVVGKSFAAFLHPDCTDHFKEYFQHHKSVGEVLGSEFEMIKRDGSPVTVLFNGTTARDEKGRFNQTHCFFYNITHRKQQEETLQKAHNELEGRVQKRTGELEKANVQLKQELGIRKQTEHALRESENKYRNFFNNTQVGLFRARLSDGKILGCNDKFAHIAGYENLEECCADFITVKHHVECGDCERALAVLEETGKIENYEVCGKRRDGSSIWVRYSCVLNREKGYVEGVMTEITEEKHTKEELQESEKKYRLLIENLPGVVFRGYRDWSIEFVDDKVEALTGYEVEEFNSRRMKWSDILFEEDIEIAKKIFIQALKGDKSYVREYRIKSKSGANHWIQERGQIVCSDSGWFESVDGAIFDITDRKCAEKEKSNLQAQLLHAQKMEAIGTLTGGIAHDFNNILQAISGYTELLLIEKEGQDPDYENLIGIKEAAHRASDLTQRLLVFGRKVEMKLRPMDLNHEIAQVSRLLNRTIPKMVKIELQLSKNLKLINADPLQLEQVIINLGINARDAMPDGGKLILETENVILDDVYCKTHLGSVPGEYVLLTISDTGLGMDKEIQEHIFEPFFTTKETGKGTGLGMAVVYSIVKSHEGYIMCYSEPSQGTSFKIYFPVLKHGGLEQEKKQIEREIIPGGSETILIVDDEEPVLNFGRKILERHGYTIMKASSGEKAIEIYTTEKDRIDLVILDVGMPGMGGHKCLRKLFQIDPQVPIIISSGYPATGKVRETIESGAVGFIKKPFQIKDLLKIVRNALDK